jgi:hypothetical protein
MVFVKIFSITLGKYTFAGYGSGTAFGILIACLGGKIFSIEVHVPIPFHVVLKKLSHPRSGMHFSALA